MMQNVASEISDCTVTVQSPCCECVQQVTDRIGVYCVRYILVQEPVSCEVTNITIRYMDFILDLDEEFNCQKPVCLDSNRKH